MLSLGLLKLKLLLKHGVTSVSGELSVYHFALRLRNHVMDYSDTDSICLLCMTIVFDE